MSESNELFKGRLGHGESSPVARASATAVPLLPTELSSRLSGYIVEIAPHVRSPETCHKIAEEIIVVQKGTVRLTASGRDHILTTGEYAYLPPGTWHRMETAEEAVELLCFHSPKVDDNHDFFVREDHDG